MVELKEFLELNPLDKKNGEFADKELLKLEDKIPTDLFEFFKQEQRSVYGNGFFWTVLPSDYHEILNNWGLDGNNCYAFLRSSFGCIAYYYEKAIYVLNPQEGENTVLGNADFEFIFNSALAYTGNLKYGFCYDLHLKYRDSLPALNEDEMYTLVPSLPLGGDREISKVEVVKMKEQLDILAQLFDHKTTD